MTCASSFSGGRVDVLMYSLSHADSLLHGKTERAVECGYTLVSFPDLQIHLYASLACERALSEANQLRTDASSAVRRRNGDRIDPAPMPVVSRHRRANHQVAKKGDEEKLISERDLLFDDQRGLVVRHFVAKDSLPKCDHPGAMISVGVRTDGNTVHDV